MTDNYTIIKPFAGLRPTADLVEKIVSPPYDVINRLEAKQLAADNTHRFLAVTKPEISLPDAIDAYDEQVYAKGRDNLTQMIEQGDLKQDDQACYYLYRLSNKEHAQTGLVCIASVQAYLDKKIKVHEYTRPDKELDRIKLTRALDGQMSPVFLTYRYHAAIEAIFEQSMMNSPEYDLTTADGVTHQFWKIDDAETIQTLTEQFEAIGELYVADGHHRSATAVKIALKSDNPSHQFILSVCFPDNEMQILSYNRVLNSLNGHTSESLIEQIEKNFSISKSDTAVKPAQAGELGMYLDHQWYRLNYKHEDSADPVESLDVSLLHNHVINPIFGISNPRTDKRIDFVGGTRSIQELERLVNEGEMLIAFSLYPTQLKQLLAVADNDQVMPPKSTWFSPKLLDGFIGYRYS